LEELQVHLARAEEHDLLASQREDARAPKAEVPAVEALDDAGVSTGDRHVMKP
jgi:hypothetical protein